MMRSGAVLAAWTVAVAALAAVPAHAQTGACCRPNGTCFAADTAAACANPTDQGAFLPGQACTPTPCAPDLIVAELGDAWRFGAEVVDGVEVQAFAFGTTACNVGTSNVLWQYTTSFHPIIAQDLFRLAAGRLEHVGSAWVKHTGYGSSRRLCGDCPFPTDGASLGVGCSDPYNSRTDNGLQRALGPRSEIDAATAAFAYTELTPDTWPPYNGIAARRLQVATADLSTPGALYFIQAQYLAPDEAAAGKGFNNASYKRVAFDATFEPTVQGVTQRERPVIYAWRDHGLGIDTPDPSVTITPVDVPGDGRLLVASKATDLGTGRWRYDYAVQNLNSDRGGGSFSVRLPPGRTVTNLAFHGVRPHSGEPVDGTDWVPTVNGAQVSWTAAPPANPAHAPNRLRFGSIFTFSLEADAPPRAAAGNGRVTLGLHKPGTPAAVSMAAVAPTCPTDLDGAGAVDVVDIFSFLALWFAQDPRADFDGTPGVDARDIFAFLAAWFAGC